MEREVVVSGAEKFDPGIVAEVLGDVATVRTTDARTIDELVAAAEGADALIPWYVGLTADALDRLDGLSVVGIPGTGVGAVDHEAAAERGITVVNAPTYAADEVSTHAMALLLACVRSITTYDDAVREGTWHRSPGEPIRRLRGRTLGLLAFGDIARRMAAKARGFGLDVLAYDPYVDDGVFGTHDVERVDFGSLLDRSELLSLHAPLSGETRGMLDADAFAGMGEDVILVNTGRGPVIEEAALLDALDDGTVLRAGLDVFETEPPEGSPLLGRDDVVLSPHVAWYSEESREDCIRSVAEDIRREFEGEEPIGRVDPDVPWV